jgi:hypothetical protein
MELKHEQIVIGNSARFHMLRHFTSVSMEMLEAIRQNGHREADIQQMLITPGSRFSDHFAQSIDSLIDQLLKYPYTKNQGITGNLELSWEIPKHEWVYGIGTNSIVSIHNLNKEQRSNLYKKENRGISLWHLDVQQLPITTQCTMILKIVTSGYQFITSFPGSASMPLPDKKMSEEVLNICRDYWERHVFMVIGK